MKTRATNDKLSIIMCMVKLKFTTSRRDIVNKGSALLRIKFMITSEEPTKAIETITGTTMPKIADTLFAEV